MSASYKWRHSSRSWWEINYKQSHEKGIAQLHSHVVVNVDSKFIFLYCYSEVVGIILLNPWRCVSHCVLGLILKKHLHNLTSHRSTLLLKQECKHGHECSTNCKHRQLGDPALFVVIQGIEKELCNTRFKLNWSHGFQPLTLFFIPTKAQMFAWECMKGFYVFFLFMETW